MVNDKRKRGIPYFDNIDLEILEFLNKPNYTENREGWKVIDLVNELKITHVSLKPHIDKLLRLKLILTKDLSDYKQKGKIFIKNKKVGLTTIKASNNYYMDNIVEYEDEDGIEEIKEENERFDNVIKLLQKIRKYFYDKEQEEYLGLDLRSKETQKEFSKK